MSDYVAPMLNAADCTQVDVKKLRAAMKGVDEVAFADPGDNGYVVRSRQLRALLSAHKDAVVLLTETGVEVRWGSDGRVCLEEVSGSRHASVRVFDVPNLYIRPQSTATHRVTGQPIVISHWNGHYGGYRCTNAQGDVVYVDRCDLTNVILAPEADDC